MKEDLFNELVESVKEGGAILRGEMKPSREFIFEPIDVQSIRKKMDYLKINSPSYLVLV